MAKEERNFEECISEIDTEINKRRGKWSLSAISWMDYEDVSQILRFHIFKKWHLYDPEKNIKPWIRTIISNQIKNLIRNNYGNFTRPCLRCAAAESTDLCTIYEKQCNACPLYAQWEKTKKRAHDTKLPLSLENHTKEIHSIPSDGVDVELAAEKLHEKMKGVLKANEWQVYRYLYIDHLTEDQVAKKMGYKTSEKNRLPGYKQIKNIRKKIIDKVKKILGKGDVDIF